MQSMRRKRDKNLEYVSDAATRSTATFTGSAGGAAASVGTVLIPAAADKVENNTRSRAIVLLGSWTTRAQHELEMSVERKSCANACNRGLPIRTRRRRRVTLPPVREREGQTFSTGNRLGALFESFSKL